MAVRLWAFAFVFGQFKVVEMSNENVAVPKLLDMRAIEGATVTNDAMGCQRRIAERRKPTMFWR